MTKSQLIKFLGSTGKVAEVTGVSGSAVSQWPEELSLKTVDRIVGACIRLDIKVPDELINNVK